MVDLPAEPTIIGPFRVLERLGAGAFAAVYRGERTDRPGHLALKVLNPRVVRSSPQHVMALKEEARFLSAVQSPHVVRSHGHAAFEGPDGEEWHVLALDFVQGVTLLDLGRLITAMPGRVPLGAVARIADDVLAGLAATHDARDSEGHLGVVHRDLTPVNVMVDEAGTTRLLDLGIAWARERAVMTEAGLTKGTPPWMSPEQLQGERLDARSDLYVLGVLMFDLLSATPWCGPRGPGRPDEVVMNDCLFMRFGPREAQLRADVAARFNVSERSVAPLLELVRALLSVAPRDRPARAGAARARIRGIVPNEERSRGMLGRMARGIRLARQEEARGPAPDADATQLFHT